MLGKLYLSPRAVLNPENPGLMKNANRQLKITRELKNSLDEHSHTHTYLSLELIERRLEEL